MTETRVGIAIESKISDSNARDITQVLKDIYVDLLWDLRKNPRPASPYNSGLWAHHTEDDGLLEHSHAVTTALVRLYEHESGPWDEVPDVVIAVAHVLGYGHDIGKLYLNGKPESMHAKISYEVIRNLIASKYKEYVNHPLIESVLLAIRWHHMNFEKPEAFARLGEGIMDQDTFAITLWLIGADLMSIALKLGV